MNFKRIKALVLALSMLCCMVAMAACGKQEQPGPVENDPTNPQGDSGYRVKVVDAFGQPLSDGIIVRFMQGSQQASMQVVGEDGTVTADLADGEYTVELKFTDNNAAYYYDQTGLTLNTQNRELEITLYHAISGEPQVLFAPSLKGDSKEHNAYHVTVGGTYVDLIPGERNYFLFAPTEAGTYEFSVQGSQAAIGYYGAPHFVQQLTLMEPVNNVITESIRDSMIGTNGTGTAVLVLGLDVPEGETSAIFTVRRTGDPAWSIEDEPWHVYQATHDLTPYTLPAGATLGAFDLKAASNTYNLVLDGEGYYHLDSADGPLVLVKLGAASGGSEYLAAFETILEHSGVTKYFYDENGNFVKKESYSECLLEYIGCMDEKSGLYPLTEDLKYIIQMRGDHYGWFDPSSAGYIFKDVNNNPVPGINHDISWLFMCCYLEN